MTNVEKFSDRAFFEEIINIMKTGEVHVEPELIIAKAEGKIASIDRKAERAKELRAEKRALGDELSALTLDALTEEWALDNTIAKKVSAAAGTEYSASKIRYRLIELCKTGDAECMDATVEKEDGKKVLRKVYRLAVKA